MVLVTGRPDRPLRGDWGCDFQPSLRRHAGHDAPGCAACPWPTSTWPVEGDSGREFGSRQLWPCHAREMSSSIADKLFHRFGETAVAVTEERPQVDPAMVQDIFDEAATMLHNGLALDHLDDHDADIVISGLCMALCRGGCDDRAVDPVLRRHRQARRRARPDRGCPGVRERPEDLAALTPSV